MKSHRSLVLVALVAVSIAGGAYWMVLRSRQAAEAPVLYGNVDIRAVELAFRQPGRLVEVLVQEGDRVKRGDVVATLDDRPLKDALAAADADVARVSAELEKILRGNRPQDIRRGEAAVAQAQAVVDRVTAEHLRQLALMATGVTSQKTLDSAASARAEAVASLQAAEQELSLLREGSRREDVASARARLAAAEALRSQARTAVEDAQLRAPDDGIVLARIKEPGSLLLARDPVVSLSLAGPTYVRAYVPETQLGQVAPGTPVWVKSDSSPTWHQAQVGFVSPRAEFTPKSVETTELRTDLVYRLRIVVLAPDAGLLQGMPVTVRLDTPAST